MKILPIVSHQVTDAIELFIDGINTHADKNNEGELL